jgi:hypothetical protein
MNKNELQSLLKSINEAHVQSLSEMEAGPRGQGFGNPANYNVNVKLTDYTYSKHEHAKHFDSVAQRLITHMMHSNVYGGAVHLPDEEDAAQGIHDEYVKNSSNSPFFGVASLGGNLSDSMRTATSDYLTNNHYNDFLGIANSPAKKSYSDSGDYRHPENMTSDDSEALHSRVQDTIDHLAYNGTKHLIPKS